MADHKHKFVVATAMQQEERESYPNLAHLYTWMKCDVEDCVTLHMCFKPGIAPQAYSPLRV